MISYDVQNALRDKADNWKVQNLENELSRTQRELFALEGDLTRKQNQIDNLNDVLIRLLENLQGLSDQNDWNDLDPEYFQTLRNQL